MTSSRLRSLCLVMMLVALATSACEKANPASPSQTPTDASAASAATRVVSLGGNLAFGAVEIGKASELTLTIGNSGTGTLSVTGIACPAGYTANWTNGTIAPGGSRQVTVRFAPTAAQSYDGTLTVSGDHTGGANTAPVSGTGAAPASLLATIAGIAAELGAGGLSGATIEVRDGPDSRKWTTTDETGRFTLSGLQAGRITVRASKSGYSDTEQQVALAAGAVATLSFSVSKSAAPTPAPPAPAPQTPDPSAPAPPTPAPPPAPPAPAPVPPATSPTALDDQVLALINDHRRSIGKPALVKNQVIWEQANGHSQNMASKAVPFGHDGFEARIAVIKAALGSGGYPGENVAMGFNSAESVVNAWLGSAGHRANIEGNSTRTGVSSVKSNGGTWYFTQVFY